MAFVAGTTQLQQIHAGNECVMIAIFPIKQFNICAGNDVAAFAAALFVAIWLFHAIDQKCRIHATNWVAARIPGRNLGQQVAGPV